MEQNTNYTTDRIGTGSIGKLLFSFSIPAIIGMVVIALYNIVDRIYVGHAVGREGIAAIAVTMPVTMALMATSMLIGIGANALFAIKMGEGKRHEVEKIMGHAFLLLFLVPLCFIAIPSFIFLDKILILLGASEEILPYAVSYMRIILYGSIFFAMGPGINHFIRSDGHPKTSMFTQLLGAGLNIILDPIFIFGFGWGIEGAAWATVIAQIVSFTWVMFYFNSKFTTLRFRIRKMKLELKLTLAIISIGFAPFAMQMAISLINFLLNRQLQVYGGDVAVATMGIIYSIAIMAMMPLQGICQGSQPIIGYNYGAGKIDRVLKAWKLSVLWGTIFITLGFFLMQFFPQLLVSAFVKKDVELMELSITAIRICTLMFPVTAFQIITSNFFQAIGKPLQSFFLSLSKHIFLVIPLLIILPKYFGLLGLFYAYPIADFTAFLITLLLMKREVRILKKMQHSIL